MNVKLLEKVAQAILNHPDNTNMDRFIDHNSVSAPCGTTGCIAGWSAALGDLEKLRRIWNNDANVEWRARQELDITVQQAANLFYAGCWPEQFKDRWRNISCVYSSPECRKIRAQIIVDRIRHFIKTDGRE